MKGNMNDGEKIINSSKLVDQGKEVVEARRIHQAQQSKLDEIIELCTEQFNDANPLWALFDNNGQGISVARWSENDDLVLSKIRLVGYVSSDLTWSESDQDFIDINGLSAKQALVNPTQT